MVNVAEGAQSVVEGWDLDYINKVAAMGCQTKSAHDPVSHPSHYTSHPSGIECIQVTEHMNFNLGNAVKYLWRFGLKNTGSLVDLDKAVWYIQREKERFIEEGKRQDEQASLSL